jgi:acyl-CoA synthetase (AMP-forming)/AMP-acid ligase II
MKSVLTLGQMLTAHARLCPERTGTRDLERGMTFREWNERARRLANGLLGLGLTKGDRVAVLAYNAIEWAEIYVAAAKAGLVAVPLNFRLIGPEIRYIVDDSEAAAFIVQGELLGAVEDIGQDLSVPPKRRIWFGAGRRPAGYIAYEDLIAAARNAEPHVSIAPEDPWMLMYTSGTTGNPKGVIRNHRGGAMLSLVTQIELGMNRNDGALLVMPMCHANSLYFFGAFAYCGATTTIYNRKSFDPEHCARVLGEGLATFTSLVPTHYAMMLALPGETRSQLKLDRVARLMISSAPARPEAKRAIMEMFPHAGLFELYGSTETGWVTMLHPEEQFDKLGSVGRECVGSAPIQLLEPDGKEVPDGQVGELYANNAYLFDGYWKLPKKTREAFRGDYCTVGDMARRDSDGFIHLVDRKSNMIITGGENVYPSDVEAVISGHPSVHDVVVIGLRDDKWGERVHAVIVLREGAPQDETSLNEWCKARMAGHKRPRSFSFMRDEDMPRTATGKNLHRKLKAMIVSSM